MTISFPLCLLCVHSVLWVYRLSLFQRFPGSFGKGEGLSQGSWVELVLGGSSEVTTLSHGTWIWCAEGTWARSLLAGVWPSRDWTQTPQSLLKGIYYSLHSPLVSEWGSVFGTNATPVAFSVPLPSPVPSSHSCPLGTSVPEDSCLKMTVGLYAFYEAAGFILTFSYMHIMYLHQKFSFYYLIISPFLYFLSLLLPIW